MNLKEYDKKAHRFSVMANVFIFAGSILLVLFLLYGCCQLEDREMMECEQYTWHGHPVNVCGEL